MNFSELVVKGIKCDNPDCDYIDMTVRYEDYPKWLNRPCPKCGANLLTEKDFKKIQKMMSHVEFLNKVFSLANKKGKDATENAPLLKVHLDMNGTGKVRAKKIEIE